MQDRLQKILANAGICSRRKAEEYILSGRVAVDGEIITAMGFKIDPRAHTITVDNQPIKFIPRKVYLLLNKPAGYVTTLNDPQGRPVVTALTKTITERIFPVGRLDFETEGALLLTNDGDLAQKVLHPKYEIRKTYLAIVAGKVSRAEIAALEEGIMLNEKKTWPAKIEVIETTAKLSKLKIIIHEGRKRQVRRMCAAIGHKVTYLKRIAYGGLHLGDLQPGKYRLLNKTDLKKLFS
jgi:pseudouridine synthase